MSKTEALRRARAMVGPLIRWGHNDWRFSSNEDGCGWRESLGRPYFHQHAVRGQRIRDIACDLRKTPA
jgi:hypothetical protein